MLLLKNKGETGLSYLEEGRELTLHIDHNS